MTLAPNPAATSDVRSVELLSTTTTSSTKSGMARRTFSIPCSSLRQGIMTVIVWPLYMGGRLFDLRQRHNSRDDIRQAFSAPALLLRTPRGGRPGVRAHCLHSLDVARTRSVSRQSPHQLSCPAGGD